MQILECAQASRAPAYLMRCCLAHRLDDQRAGFGILTFLQSRLSRWLPSGCQRGHPLGVLARPQGAPTEKVPLNLTEVILAQGSNLEACWSSPSRAGTMTSSTRRPNVYMSFYSTSIVFTVAPCSALAHVAVVSGLWGNLGTAGAIHCRSSDPERACAGRDLGHPPAGGHRR